MSEFTDKDRERAQKTLTLLKHHVKLSDERHQETKKILDKHDTQFEKHDKRIKASETFRAWILGAMGFGTLGGIGTAFKFWDKG